MIEPTSTADPATCTEVPDYRKKFDYPRELIFDHDNSDVTFDQATNPSNQLVPGAIESLTFDRDGNRTGSPVVVRLCPLADNETRTQTVLVTPGYAGDCP
jgi:hypothetical protein